MAYLIVQAGGADILDVIASALQPERPKVYLKSYDPEAFGGHGDVRWTDDRAQAKRFVDMAACFVEWKRVPENHPVRETDGQPNRPLTAYSITFEKVDDVPTHHPNGAPMWADDGTLLNDKGNRSIFDDVDK